MDFWFHRKTYFLATFSGNVATIASGSPSSAVGPAKESL